MEGRPAVVDLLERVVEILSRLLGARIGLAGRQLHASAALAARRAGWALAGALALAVALGLLAAAAAELLAPYLASLPLRLAVVAGACALLGLGLLARAARPPPAGDAEVLPGEAELPLRP